MSDKILGFAVSNGGNSWRRAWSDEPLNTDETWSETQPTPTADFVAKQAAKEARKAAAKANAKTVTGIKTLAFENVAAYVEANSGNANAQLRTLLTDVIKSVVSLNNEIWPDMPESNGNALK